MLSTLKSFSTVMKIKLEMPDWLVWTIVALAVLNLCLEIALLIQKL